MSRGLLYMKSNPDYYSDDYSSDSDGEMEDQSHYLSLHPAPYLAVHQHGKPDSRTVNSGHNVNKAVLVSDDDDPPPKLPASQLPQSMSRSEATSRGEDEGLHAARKSAYAPSASDPASAYQVSRDGAQDQQSSAEGCPRRDKTPNLDFDLHQPHDGQRLGRNGSERCISGCSLQCWEELARVGTAGG